MEGVGSMISTEHSEPKDDPRESADVQKDEAREIDDLPDDMDLDEGESTRRSDHAARGETDVERRGRSEFDPIEDAAAIQRPPADS